MEMLKKIFAAFIGSMAALWISVGLFFCFMFMMLAMIVGAGAEDTARGKGNVLYLDMTGAITDRYSAPGFEAMLLGQTEPSQSFETITNAVRLAADDDDIDYMYIECGGSSLGFALREELVEALNAFKKSGKKIFAYSDSYTQGDYYIASLADEVVLNPIGAVDVRGIASQIPFFKGALDKLGVEMQIVKVGTFKSAVEPYILTEPSEPSIMQTRVFLDAIWRNVGNTIAKNRRVSFADINMWADSIIATYPAEQLVDMKVVDKTMYRHEFEDMIRKLTDTKKGDPLPLVTPDEYMAGNVKVDFDKIRGHIGKGKHIAVLYAVGDIVDEGSEGIVGPAMVSEILDLAEDDDVNGLVLRVNSGGGSAFASEQIWEALEQFKDTGKPFYVSMADYAASGGYYISCGADRIYADASTITGSIGIFGMVPCVKGLLTDHLGVNIATIGTNPNAALGSILDPLTPAQHAALQRNVDEGYALFTGRVAEGRQLPVDSVLAIAEGRVWDGRTALSIGLVDEIGSLRTAVHAMARKLGMKKAVTASYPKIELSPFEELLLQSGGVQGNMADLQQLGLEGLTPDEARQSIRLLRDLRGMSPVQARMEPVTLM